MTVLIIFGVFVLIVIAMYNSLIEKKNQVENAFSSIDTQLKKRFDLIPNLVSVVKGYMQHEQKILTNITKLRSKAVAGNVSVDQKVNIYNQISKTLTEFLVTVENYPELKANKNFLLLQKSLNEIEEQVAASRRFYNASVADYNNAVDMFPTNILAFIMNYKKKCWFEIPEYQRENSNIDNLIKK